VSRLSTAVTSILVTAPEYGGHVSEGHAPVPVGSGLADGSAVGEGEGANVGGREVDGAKLTLRAGVTTGLSLGVESPPHPNRKSIGTKSTKALRAVGPTSVREIMTIDVRFDGEVPSQTDPTRYPQRSSTS
jgi:hypothetical protein